ncbi:MAG: DUF1800 domain-containing protein [Robiginitomaculum sp.]|nr:DUF1800 domain-containing protein [Robiginitomaculum sp.]
MSIVSLALWIRGRVFTLIFILTFPIFLSACGGGSTPAPPPPPPPPPPPQQVSPGFKTETSTSQFLSRSTFGATRAQINALTDTEVSDWLIDEFNKQPTLYRARISDLLLALPQDELLSANSVTNLYLDEAIAGNDQLRQRMVLALSEIVVASSDGVLNGLPATMAQYVDILSGNAFGNYRDLMEDITYSPAMSVYLTYLANEKGNMATGRVPDENYAREILQLFSIGLVELEMDGTPKTNGQGQQIDTYDNSDITGLAKVFTGLSLQDSNFYNIFRNCPDFQKCPRLHQPLEMFEQFHSELEKTFLDLTIPANTNGTDSIQMALDEIFSHPNVAPFISRQLIQRFVTSHPKPQYVRRVATAFESGRFTLPDGTAVGAGQRGDLKATLAAVLLDDNATRLPSQTPSDFGKIREPMLRFINLARTFGETTPDSEDEWRLRNMTRYLGQHPFKAKHVFNFFEPEHVAPGTQTGAAGLTIPELQIVNESSAISYINFINWFIYDTSPTRSGDPDGGVNVDYTAQLALADDAQALVDNLDLLLTGQQLSNVTKDRIVELLAEIPVEAGSEDEDRISRVRVAVSMVMTSPGYLVQR